MKKSLIALAVLAASGAAMAQSSVQVYGVADLWFGTITSKTNGVKNYANNGAGQTGLFDGGVSNSRFGLKGTEDLGGGLKANFVFEQGFSLDSGASSSNGFNRQAWVGLSGGFGEVQFGKAYNAFDDVSGMAATVFDSDLAPINNVFASTSVAGAFANTIKYSTPAFGGFSGGLSYTMGENKTPTTKATSSYALSGKYAEGPLAAGVGYYDADQSDFVIAGTTVTFTDVKATRIAGSYDLGVAKLLASYGSAKGNLLATEVKASEWEIGADVPLSSSLALSVGYANQTVKAAGTKVGKVSSYGAALAYSLSKRTTVYAGLNNTKAEDVPLTQTDKQTIYAVGLKHTF